MSKKDKEVVDLGESDYAAKIAAAKANKVPLGGAPMPPMPRFDQAPGDRFSGVQNQKSLHRILSPQEQEALAASGQLIPGVGAAYAANQPRGAQMPTTPPPSQPPQPQGFEIQGTSGEYANPPRGEGAGLRQETARQLEAVAKANQAAEDAKVDADLAKTAEEIDEIDETYETDEFGNRVRSLLNNQKRRDQIEKRCSPMAFEDLITQGEIRQKVPILPGKFEPTYRSVAGNEDLYIKRKMGGMRGGQQFLMDNFTIFNLTAGLYALNNKTLPSHLDKDGEVDEKAFDAKYKIISKMSLSILSDLSVNYVWFQRRLQKLFVVDEIKGF